MPSNVFISYDHDDSKQVEGFKSLVDNPNHPLAFHDHSLKEPVKDKHGNVIKVPPSDPRADPIKEEIRKKFEESSRLVVLIGDKTHDSEWVEWEIETFYEMKKKVSGDKTWKRLRGMRLKGSERAETPRALLDGKSTQPMDWDPKKLDEWLDGSLE